MIPPVTDSRFKQRVLDRKLCGARIMFPRHVLETAEFDLVETEAGNVLLGVRAEVLSEKVESRVQTAKLNVSATWWQHFKDTYAPYWYLKRWPVRYTTWTCDVHFEGERHYPDARIDLPLKDFGRPIIYETTTHGDWYSQ